MTEEVEYQRNRIEEIFEYGLDAEHWTIYLQGIEDGFAIDSGEDPEINEPGIEFRVANRFIKALDVLSGMDVKQHITVSMKTCGGDWYEGMAIYDAIMAVANPVTIVSYVHARSMSSIILQAANKRVLMPHSYVMIHQGTDSIEGTTRAVGASIEFGKQTQGQMLNIYIDRMKARGKASRWGRKRIFDWLQRQMEKKEDVYFTPQEAVNWGLADEVFIGWGNVPDMTKAQKGFKK